MDERLARIRESERKSHTEIYTNEVLYNTDSWLQRPIKTVREIAEFFDGYHGLRILDFLNSFYKWPKPFFQLLNYLHRKLAPYILL